MVGGHPTIINKYNCYKPQRCAHLHFCGPFLFQPFKIKLNAKNNELNASIRPAVQEQYQTEYYIKYYVF